MKWLRVLRFGKSGDRRQPAAEALDWLAKRPEAAKPEPVDGE
jgi:hypothetical protein